MKKKLISAILALAFLSVITVSAYSESSLQTKTQITENKLDTDNKVSKSDVTKKNKVYEEKEAGSDAVRNKADSEVGENTNGQVMDKKAKNSVLPESENQQNESSSSKTSSDANSKINTNNPTVVTQSGCNHNWEAQYKQVTVPAKGHYEPTYETVIDYENRPIYKPQVVCGCGEIFNTAEEWGSHSFNGCNQGYSVQDVFIRYDKVQVGTHQEQTGSKWVEDQAQYEKNEVVGYQCTKCGSWK